MSNSVDDRQARAGRDDRQARTGRDDFLAAVDWGAVSKRLLVYTFRRLRRLVPSQASEERAMEIVHDAIVHLLDDVHRNWSPAQPDEQGLLLHLGSEINGIIINDQRKVIRRPTAAPLSERHEPAALASELSAIDATNLLDRALEQVGRDSESGKVLLLFADGCTKAADQAKELGWPIKKVYKIREQVRLKLREIRT